MALHNSSQGGSSKHSHDFNPRSERGPGFVVILLALFIFLCFVVMDPWKVVQPIFLPTPAPEIEPVPPRPDLTKIQIKGRLRAIHHAVLKEIRKDGLIFVADEGLVKAAYKDLPSEFSKYYLYIAAEQRKRTRKAPTLLTDDSAPLNATKAGGSAAPSTTVPRS